MTWEENRDVIQMCRGEISKVKAKRKHGKVNNKKKILYVYWSGKKSVPPLINEKRQVPSTHVEKTEVLGELFASVFTGSQTSQFFFHIPESLGRCKGRKISPAVRAEQVRDGLMRLT